MRFFFCLHQGGLVWSPFAAEDSMDALYPDLAQVSLSVKEHCQYLGNCVTSRYLLTVAGLGEGWACNFSHTEIDRLISRKVLLNHSKFKESE